MSEIWASIAQDNERAADELVRRLARKASLAAEMPSIGVARPEIAAGARFLIEGRYS